MEGYNQFKKSAVLPIVMMMMAVWMVGVDGSSYGAPLTSCETMGNVHVIFPSHPVDTSPFGITFDQATISSGDTVSLVLSPKANQMRRPEFPAVEGYFTGYLLMAFNADDEASGPLGHFSGINATKGQFIDCYGRSMSAVTHVNPNFKPKINVDWTAPEDFRGKVVFRATFTESLSSLWAKVPSDNLTVVEPSTSTTKTTPAVTTTQPPTTTPGGSPGIVSSATLILVTSIISSFFLRSN